MRATEQLNELSTALAKAQPRFGQIKRNKTVKVRTQGGAEYSFDYAPLEEVIEATRVPLSEVGLSLVHPIETTETHVTAGARLSHSSGQWIENLITIPRPAKMQELGSALTYIKRYCTQGVLGVQADDDDDANVADGNHIQKSETRAPRRPPGTISKKDEPHEKVKAEKLSALEAAGAAAFQPDAPVPYDDRTENPREVHAEKLLFIKGVEALPVDCDPLRYATARQKIVGARASGKLDDADEQEIEAALLKHEAANPKSKRLTTGDKIKPKKEVVPA